MSDMDAERHAAHEETRRAWDANAAYWDAKIGEGNDFVNELIWPATTQLLDLQPGERVLDIACGNGLYARRLAALGAEVVAFDFSEKQIEHAQARTTEHDERITYRVLDATDETALLDLGERGFDAAVCEMALFDMAEIDPLMRALSRLLKPGGHFLFSVLHPCFNNAASAFVAEQMLSGGEFATTYAVKVSRYLTPTSERGVAIRGQPQLQVYFDRPLQGLLGACFEVGFVMDALVEPSFPKDHPSGSEGLSWGGNFSDIPPVLVARMRLPVP